MTYISFIIISLYIIYVLINIGVPHSLSATYYNFGKLFSISLLLSAATLMPEALQFFPENLKFLSFLALGGVIFVAISPDFLGDKLVDIVHTISATIILISSQILVTFTNPLLLLEWIPILIYIGLTFKKYKILEIPKIKFLSELVMILTIYQMLI